MRHVYRSPLHPEYITKIDIKVTVKLAVAGYEVFGKMQKTGNVFRIGIS